MNPPAIGLIGCGRWGRNILRDLCSLGAAVSVVAPSKDSRMRAAELGAQSSFTEIGDLLASGPLDGIVVATPTSTHYEIVDMLLERAPGVPIFCEKCLCPDAAQARALAARAENLLFVMDKWRYHPGIESLAGLARSGELGKVLGIRTTRVGWGCPHRDVDSVWILLSHELSILLEILGGIPEPIAACADAVNGWAHGMLATLGSAPWAVLEVSSRSPKTVRETKVFFERGVAMLDDSYASEITITPNPRGAFSGEAPVERRPISTEMPLRAELAAFLAFIRSDGPAPKSSAHEGALIVEHIAALRALAGL